MVKRLEKGGDDRAETGPTNLQGDWESRRDTDRDKRNKETETETENKTQKHRL